MSTFGTPKYDTFAIRNADGEGSGEATKKYCDEDGC